MIWNVDVALVGPTLGYNRIVSSSGWTIIPISSDGLEVFEKYGGIMQRMMQ